MSNQNQLTLEFMYDSPSRIEQISASRRMIFFISVGTIQNLYVLLTVICRDSSWRTPLTWHCWNSLSSQDRSRLPRMLNGVFASLFLSVWYPPHGLTTAAAFSSKISGSFMSLFKTTYDYIGIPRFIYVTFILSHIFVPEVVLVLYFCFVADNSITIQARPITLVKNLL